MVYFGFLLAMDPPWNFTCWCPTMLSGVKIEEQGIVGGVQWDLWLQALFPVRKVVHQSEKPVSPTLYVCREGRTTPTVLTRSNYHGMHPLFLLPPRFSLPSSQLCDSVLLARTKTAMVGELRKDTLNEIAVDILIWCVPQLLVDCLCISIL